MPSWLCRGTAVQLRQATVHAQFNLGYLLRNGEGVVKDAEQALSWYRRAAEAGHADAQFNLGDLLRSTVKGLPRMQSRPYRGTAVQLRRA